MFVEYRIADLYMTNRLVFKRIHSLISGGAGGFCCERMKGFGIGFIVALMFDRAVLKVIPLWSDGVKKGRFSGLRAWLDLGEKGLFSGLWAWKG